MYTCQIIKVALLTEWELAISVIAFMDHLAIEVNGTTGLTKVFEDLLDVLARRQHAFAWEKYAEERLNKNFAWPENILCTLLTPVTRTGDTGFRFWDHAKYDVDLGLR